MLLADFCDNFKLTVNELKTKILVFKNGGVLSRAEKWFYKGNRLEVVNGFTYVGLFFTTQMSLHKMVAELSVKGKRILISILSSLHTYGVLSKECFFQNI